MTTPISFGNPLGHTSQRPASGRDEGAAHRPRATTAGVVPDAGADGAHASVAALATMLNRGTMAGGQSVPAGAATGDGTAIVRPNLDALNRVLNHYAAQSAAATLPFVVLET